MTRIFVNLPIACRLYKIDECVYLRNNTASYSKKEKATFISRYLLRFWINVLGKTEDTFCLYAKAEGEILWSLIACSTPRWKPIPHLESRRKCVKEFLFLKINFKSELTVFLLNNIRSFHCDYNNPYTPISAQNSYKIINYP